MAAHRIGTLVSLNCSSRGEFGTMSGKNGHRPNPLNVNTAHRDERHRNRLDADAAADRVGPHHAIHALARALARSGLRALRRALALVLREGVELDEALVARINTRVREALSARHVPDEVHRVEAVPRTLSGKKMEIPIKRLLLGQAIDKVANPDTMANPESLAWFAAFARRREGKGAAGSGTA